MKFSVSVLLGRHHLQCSYVNDNRRGIPITEQISTFRISNNRRVFRVITEMVYVISNDTMKTERMKGFFNDFPVHRLCLISGVLNIAI
jgi:hypothetical protein